MEALFTQISVPLISGLILYIIQSIRVRIRIIDGLALEVNDLIDNAQMIKRYLSQENHHWLKAGSVITEYPTFVIGENKFFNAYLSKFYLLTRGETKKIYLFYSQVDACMHQVKILFDRIRQQSESKLPLTEDQVAFHKLRIKKISLTLESISQITNGKINKVSDLPNSYEPISFEEIGKEMNKLRETLFRKE